MGTSSSISTWVPVHQVRVGGGMRNLRVRVRGISFLKTVNTLLSESTEGRTRHKGGRAFARTCIHHEVRSAEVPKAFFTCTQQVSRSMSM